MRKSVKFNLNRKLSRKDKHPVWTLIGRYNKQRAIRWCKGVHQAGLNKLFRFRPGSGVTARKAYLIMMEDL